MRRTSPGERSVASAMQARELVSLWPERIAVGFLVFRRPRPDRYSAAASRRDSSEYVFLASV
jgi:hypothetical protein